MININLKKLSVLIFLLFANIVLANCSENNTKTQSTDSLENILKSSKGKEKAEILSRLASLYLMTDTIKSFNYFKKSLHISEKLNLNLQELNNFSYLAGSDRNEKYIKKSIKRLKKALKYTNDNNLKKGIGFANSAIGRQYLFINDYEEAKKYQNIALQKFIEIDCDYGIAVVYERLGVIYMIKNEYLKALKYYYQALNINQKLNLEHETGVSLYHIGITKLYLSNYKDAVNYILQSLKIWDKLKETANIWNCNELIGNIYIKSGNYEKALFYHRIDLTLRQKKFEKYKKINNRVSPDYLLGIAYSYNNIAEVYLDLNDYDSAYYYAIKSLRIKEKNSVASKNDVANSQLNLGNIYCKLGKYDSAYLMINQAANTYKSLQNKSSYSEAMYGLGQLNMKLKKYAVARDNYFEGMKSAKQVEDRYDVGKGYKYVSDLYSTTEDFKNSLKYHLLYIQTKDSIFNHETKNKIAELQIKYGVDKKEHKIAYQKTVIKQKQRKIKLSILIGALLLGLAITIIVFVIITKKQKQKILEKEKENLQKELELKNRDLVCNASKIYTKNLVINKVAHTLTKSAGNFKKVNISMIKDIINELKNNMDETAWTEFDIRFAKVYENFYLELDKKFPGLTANNRKICAMLKLGLNSKEIASITMTKSESVDTTRSRLRKKLGIKNNDNLSEFLNKL